MPPTPITLLCFSGRVPISFEMAPAEVTTLHHPLPVFHHSPRHSYLPLVSLQAISTFQDSAPQVGPEGVWFSTVQGHPLRWDCPLGLLYDEHGCSTLPWRILIRFRDFPHQLMLKVSLKQTESAYFHSLKQALNLLTGSARSFMDLRQTSQEALWQAIESSRFADAWKISQTLLPSAPARPNLCPVRVVSSRTHEMRQAPVPYDESLTLAQALDLILGARPWAVPVVIQGITVSASDVSLVPLLQEMAHADLFLYVCCVF